MAQPVGKISADALPALIGQIYDAAIDITQWQAFLAHLADITHSTAFIYDEEPLGRGARLFGAAGASADPAWREPFETYYSKIKPWRERLLHVRSGEIVLVSNWLDDASYRKTEYYNDCLARLDLFYNLGIDLFHEGNAHTAVALARPHRIGDFVADECRLCDRLVPHLQRAVRMNRHLRTAELERQALLRGYEKLSVGVILAARDGRVFFANRIAEEVLVHGDGLSAQQQRLHAITPALTQELHRRIREAADIGAGSGTHISGALSLPCHSGDSVSLLVCPFPVAFSSSLVGPPAPAALIFVGRPSGTTVVHQDILRQIYRFTPAEARLVSALLAGMSLRSYAAASGVSFETAKTQLDHVFAKTGHHRQVDLIRHILSDSIVQLAAKELPAAQ